MIMHRCWQEKSYITREWLVMARLSFGFHCKTGHSEAIFVLKELAISRLLRVAIRLEVPERPLSCADCQKQTLLSAFPN